MKTGRARRTRSTTKPGHPAAERRASRSAGLRRGLEILCLFSEQKPEWGISEIARALSIHKSRVHRSVKTLEDMGFLRRNAGNSRYLMGYRTFEVGSLAGRLTNRMSWARYDLKQLAHKLKATVSLRLVLENDLLVVDTVESLEHLPAHIPPGVRVPLNFGAGGQVLAAHLSDEQVRALIRRYGLPRYTESSLTSEAGFLNAVRNVRSLGYAISENETIPGSFSIAAPIIGPGNALVAVLVASRPFDGMPRARLKEMAAAVVRTARAISARCSLAA